MAYQVRDDLGRAVRLARPPERVVSLVPSDTFTVCALGAGDRLVGRTRFCVEPGPLTTAIEVVGGTKDADPDAIIALAPDLVIANQEENARPVLEALAARGIPVFVLFPRRVAEGLAVIARLARLLGIERSPAAHALCREAYALGAELGSAPDGAPRAFVPIWHQPLMTFSDDTFAADLLAGVGLRNAFGDRERRYPLAADLSRRSPIAADRVGDRDLRYPRITIDEVLERAPDIVLLPDEPHGFGEADRERFASLAIPAAARGAVRLVSGKDLFWYGAWTLAALPRLRALAGELVACG